MRPSSRCGSRARATSTTSAPVVSWVASRRARLASCNHPTRSRSADRMVIAEETLLGENVPDIRDRVVVAPCKGRFKQLPPEVFTTEGEWVEPGTVLAEVDVDGEKIAVTSAFRGW